MKTDDFEQRLQRQPLRSIPSEWREEILVAADVNRRTQPVRELTFAATFRLRLRELLWPCPQAWAGLATVWLVILVLNLATGERATTVATKQSPPPSPEMLMALREQQRLLAELIGSKETPVADKSKSALPQPRSERRNEFMMV